MTSWRTVFRLEWRLLRRDRSALVLIGSFAAVLVLAAIAGGRHAEESLQASLRSEQASTTALDARRAELEAIHRGESPPAMDPRDPVWMGEVGAARAVTLPAAPLREVAVGQRDLHPQSIRVTTDVYLNTEQNAESALVGPSRLSTGPFDPAFVFVVLFPLIVIALSYELLSGEREGGTLAMLLSMPLSQRALVLGKAGARAAALCAVTCTFALGGLLATGADALHEGGWVLAGAYALLLVVWALFWFCASVAVNAWSPNSARNALVLVGVWLVLVVIVPGVTQVVVDTWRPAPSKFEALQDAREARAEIERDLMQIEGRHDVDPTSPDFARARLKAQQELAARAAPVLAEHAAQEAARRSALESSRFASPASLVQWTLEDLAGSGSRRQARFEAQVEQYHQRFSEFFAQKIAASESLTAASLGEIPPFQFDEEPVPDVLARWGGAVGVLAVLSALLLAAAWPGLRRIGRLAA